MFHTIGARLTALATGITLGVSLLVCAALYGGVRYSLYREVDAFLAGEVMEFRTILSATGSDLDAVQLRIRAELGSRQSRDLAFRLLDGGGRVLATSDADHRQPDPGPPPLRRGKELSRFTEFRSSPGGHTRTCSQWVESPDGSVRIVQATYRLDQVDAALARFLQICGAALGVAAVLAMIGGRILAKRSLRPVANMAATARQISVENLTERLKRTGTKDELDVLAETFNAMLERLEKQVARLRQFTADAAHELRTPLTALRGNAEVTLSENRSAEELRTVIAESIEEFDRLSRIADDLLLLARADAGLQLVHRAPLRLDLALADVIDLYSVVAEDRGIDLHCPRGAEIWIDGDDGRLRQMFGNLLDNALKYTPAGGRVDVAVLTTNGTAEVTIRDTGPGIAAEHLPHIFDRFYRVDRARSREGGAGLGLAISRTIVEAHHGTIALSSRPGEGATVTVCLPLAAAVPSPAKP